MHKKYFMQEVKIMQEPTMDNIDENKWFVFVRYIIYILTLQGSKGLSMIIYNIFHNKQGLNIQKLHSISKIQLITFFISMITLLINDQKLFAEDFALFFIAYLIVEYPEIEKKPPLAENYGVGMACIFYEGYLMNVIPPDGGNAKGIEHNINVFESQGVVVPVKKLFLVITRSLYSPPDLQQFNKQNRDDLAKLEACRCISLEADADDALFQSLEDVQKSVAGVKDRVYKNSAYVVTRPGGRPVYLVAECATPLHTLYRALQNRHLFEDVPDVDVEVVSHDFCTTLMRIINKSSECRDKIELVYYDDKDRDSNLADLLLNKIRELEPNFEELIVPKQ